MWTLLSFHSSTYYWYENNCRKRIVDCCNQYCHLWFNFLNQQNFTHWSLYKISQLVMIYITEKRLSIWQLCHDCWHCKLSLRQLMVPPVTTKLSNWRSLVFIDIEIACVPFWKSQQASFHTNNGLVPIRPQAITQTYNDQHLWCHTVLQSHNMSVYRANSRLAPSQWETSLQSNAVSHWLGTT